MSEMVNRLSANMGSATAPMNRFTFRDALIAMFIMTNGPAGVEGVDKAVDQWLEELARIAIKGMREPTEAMKEAMTKAVYDAHSLVRGEGFDEPPGAAAWDAGIDEALR